LWYPRRVSGLELHEPVPYYGDVEVALRAMLEAEVRSRVMPTLLRHLGFHEVRDLHGPHEQGKDLLAFRWSELGTKDWTGFVIKRGDITAQVGSTTGIRTVLHQVEQVLDHEIIDPRTSDRSHVRGCWVVTNGHILKPALEDVAVTLRRHHLEKLVRWLDIDTLTNLITRYLSRDSLEQLLGLPSLRTTAAGAK